MSKESIKELVLQLEGVQSISTWRGIVNGLTNDLDGQFTIFALSDFSSLECLFTFLEWKSDPLSADRICL